MNSRLLEMQDGENFHVDTDRERVRLMMFASRHNISIRTEKVHGTGYRIERVKIGHPRDYFDGLMEEHG